MDDLLHHVKSAILTGGTSHPIAEAYAVFPIINEASLRDSKTVYREGEVRNQIRRDVERFDSTMDRLIMLRMIGRTYSSLDTNKNFDATFSQLCYHLEVLLKRAKRIPGAPEAIAVVMGKHSVLPTQETMLATKDIFIRNIDTELDRVMHSEYVGTEAIHGDSVVPKGEQHYRGSKSIAERLGLIERTFESIRSGHSDQKGSLGR